MEDNLYKIALTKIPHVGPKIGKTLVSYCGGMKAIFETPKKALNRIPGVGEKIVSHILTKEALTLAEKEIEFIEKNKIRVISYLDKNYPKRLAQLSDCPNVLFYKGNASLDAARIVAIVGTRQPSIHGIANCEKLVEELKSYNVLIISGLAFGIDIRAHRKCIEMDIPTIGVLGHGLSRIYPFQHKKTAMDMLENGGLLTEFSSRIGPEREHFPMRNRIIAGLCDALVVLETQKKGGSMISAYLASEFNRDVFAFPGRVSDKPSKGCNHLIKSHVAGLIENAEDLAYHMHWQANDKDQHQKQGKQQELFIQLTEDEKIIVALLKQTEAMAFDHISSASNFSNSKVAGLLLNLEFKGLVKPLPGKQYVIVA
jgi:DNA processing protein